MVTLRRNRLIVIVLLVVFALTATLVVGCGSKSSSSNSGSTGGSTAAPGTTALDGVALAKSTLSTTAPDAKLLFIQTAQAVTPTGTPVWTYLMGSPKTDKIYAVYVANGRAMGAQDYGTANLDKAEWAAVPAENQIKIDSPEALAKAMQVGGLKNTPAYMMGIISYKPKADTSTVEANVWNVQMDGGNQKIITVDVNGKTGEAKVAK